MICTTVTVTAITPTISVSGVGFDVGLCNFNIKDAINPVMMAGNVTANVKLKADVNMSWKIGGVLYSSLITQLTFSVGTQLWSFNSGSNWIAGTYTESKITFINIVAA